MAYLQSKIIRYGGIFAAALVSAAAPAFASDIERMPKDDKGIFSFIYENDLFSGNDRGYTNGVRFAWLSSEEYSPTWARWTADHMPLLSRDGRKRISIAAGQSMFTPADLRQTAPIPNDRPYAGWLYGSVGIVSDTGKTLDNVMLTLGVVGPLSGAEHTQKFIHSTIDATHPNGWHNQLKNEPGVMLTYERKWRSLFEFQPFGTGVDITPHMGANLGNIYTDAIVGATIRLGYDLPADYGPPRIRPSLPGSDFFVPSNALGGYLFAGAEGRGVARNIFLDGNTFSRSQHVSKEPFIGSLQTGIALTYRDTRLSYTHVWLNREFEQQPKAERFGVVTLSMRF